MAVRSVGTYIQIGANSIAELTSIDGLDLTQETIDSTNLSSAGGYREFIAGFKDAGEVALGGHFNSTDTLGQMAMYTAFAAGTVDTYTINYPSGATWTFTGVVTGFKTGAELEDTIAFEGTIKVSGQPSLGVTQSGGLTALSLTGAGGTLSPAFSAGNRAYTFSGVSATSVTVTATAAAHTLKLYADGVYVQDLTTAVASNAISLTLNVGKKLTIIAYEVNKAQKVYDITVVKTT